MDIQNALPTEVFTKVYKCLCETYLSGKYAGEGLRDRTPTIATFYFIHVSICYMPRQFFLLNSLPPSATTFIRCPACHSPSTKSHLRHRSSSPASTNPHPPCHSPINHSEPVTSVYKPGLFVIVESRLWLLCCMYSFERACVYVHFQGFGQVRLGVLIHKPVGYVYV